MKLSHTKYLILLLFFASCGNEEKEIKNYGFQSTASKNLNVPIKLSEFANFGMLVDRIREITCSDSISKLEIHIDNKIVNIYPNEDCDPPNFNPKSKQYLTFRNGKAYLNRSNLELNFELLNSKFKENFEYFKSSNGNGMGDYYFIIIESERNEKVDGIAKIIIELTKGYNKLNTEIPLEIAFWEIPPEPPEPPPYEND